ncbi:hypothetical protein NDU88_001565 [Pleurodeles waltl]|uniref:Uncharacterized protein n=1 Tax=Pleurodeles waltl TaxID=8319 RepID=A0AAV7W0E6_PLEWA|nr:hypothetical protein NDU88_001565 [Pleurodeles waltl]
MHGPRGLSKSTGGTAGGAAGVSKPGLAYSLKSGKRIPGFKGKDLNTGGNFFDQENHIRRNNRRSGKAPPSLKGGNLLNKERRITPSLKTYFRVLPSTLSMEGSESEQQGVLEDGATRSGQFQCSLNVFQVLEGADGGELEVCGPPGQGAVVHCTNGVQNGGSQESDMDNLPGPKGGNQQLGLDPRHQLVDQRREIPLRIPPQGIERHERVLAEEPPEKSITGMLIALSLEVKGSFKTSNANQKEIRGLCETLGEKIDELAGRTAALEEEVGDLRTAVE